MCKDFADACETVDDYFEAAEQLFPGIMEMTFSGPKEVLDQTLNTQPAMFIADILCAELLACNGMEPDGLAGFSLGEMAALFFGGSLDFVDSCAITKLRAELMSACATERPGEMYAAMRLSPEAMNEVCQSVPQCWAANYNCPGQTVISCAEESSGELRRAIAERGGKAIKLRVQGAFHSPLMQGATDRYARALAAIDFAESAYPVYSNVTARPHDIDKMAENLVKHMTSPVLWRQTVENMIADGFDTFVECGPGKVLTGLIKKIDEKVNVYNVYDMESLKETLAAFGLSPVEFPVIDWLYADGDCDDCDDCCCERCDDSHHHDHADAEEEEQITVKHDHGGDARV
jgi:[acyl-carrier-protein] S-malonyltransferase